MIITITMNPALDKSTSFEKLVPEKKMRCEELHLDAGGGGINVSKAIRKLGGNSMAVFPSGGVNGKIVEGLLNRLDIPIKPVRIGGETREDFSATERSTNAQYRFVMPGPRLAPEEVEQCLLVLDSLDPLPDFIVASGSLPPGVPEDFFALIAMKARDKGIKFVLDSSGIPLEKAVKAGVYLLKPNLAELSALVGKDSLQLNEVDDAAMHLVRTGACEVLVVSLGPSGALLVTGDAVERIQAPTVKKVSTVGAGDSMVAGMVWKLEQGSTLLDMCRFGVACGTAATMNAGTALFNTDDVHRLYDWIRGR